MQCEEETLWHPMDSTRLPPGLEQSDFLTFTTPMVKIMTGSSDSESSDILRKSGVNDLSRDASRRNASRMPCQLLAQSQGHASKLGKL